MTAVTYLDKGAYLSLGKTLTASAARDFIVRR